MHELRFPCRVQRSKGRPAGVGLHQFRLVGRLTGNQRTRRSLPRGPETPSG